MSSQSLNELLPCPFCGSKGELDEHEGKTMSGHYTADVACDNCEHVRGQQGWGKTKEDARKMAIIAWNGRSPARPSEIPLLSECCNAKIGSLLWCGECGCECRTKEAPMRESSLLPFDEAALVGKALDLYGSIDTEQMYRTVKALRALNMSINSIEGEKP